MTEIDFIWFSTFSTKVAKNTCWRIPGYEFLRLGQI